MNKWLPSGKLILFFGILTFLVVGLFLVFNNKVKYKSENLNNKDIVKNIFLKQSENDTDKDGLKDWEESLWKTDINNPDTDGDGMSDGDEIKNERNPLIKGPNDKLENNSLKKNFYKKTDNETSNIGKELIGEYIGLKNSGLINSSNKEKMISYMIEDKISSLENDYKNIKKFSLDDLNIINNENIDILNNYEKNILSILDKGKKIPNDLAVLEKSLKEKDKKILDELDKTISSYKIIQKELLNTDTPYIFKEKHLKIINLISDVIFEVKSMKNIFEDPIKTIVNLKPYQENTKEIITLFYQIAVDIKEKNK